VSARSGTTEHTNSGKHECRRKRHFYNKEGKALETRFETLDALLAISRECLTLHHAQRSIIPVAAE